MAVRTVRADGTPIRHDIALSGLDATAGMVGRPERMRSQADADGDCVVTVTDGSGGERQSHAPSR
jgi:hypothetical protein